MDSGPAAQGRLTMDEYLHWQEERAPAIDTAAEAAKRPGEVEESGEPKAGANGYHGSRLVRVVTLP